MRTYRVVTAGVFALAGLVGEPVNAQQLPSPSRSAYRCEVDGKVIYSDTPCLGARRVDVEPSRGMTTSGVEMPGADVRKEHAREGLAQAIQPITGMNARQFDASERRMKLTPAASRECRQLDADIPAAENAERLVVPQEKARIRAQILNLRRRFQELRC